MSRISPNPSVTERAEAEEAIKDFEHLELAQPVIRDRIAYRKAARDGLCVAELRPTDPKAVEEATVPHHVPGERAARVWRHWVARREAQRI